MFLGHVYNVDVGERQVGVSWLIIGCGKYKWEGTTTYGSDQCGRLNVAANFFVDGYVQSPPEPDVHVEKGRVLTIGPCSASQPNSSYDPSSNPVYPGTNDPI